MSCCSDICPDTLVLLSSLISILISEDLTTDDINVLGNVLTQIGASLLTKAAQQQSLLSRMEKCKTAESRENTDQQECPLSKDEINTQIADIEEQLEKLKQQLC